jgi:hypothetical protein
MANDPIADAILRQPRGVGMNAGYFNGYVPSPVRRIMTMSVERPLVRTPTGEREPYSAAPQSPVWANTNCPPWVCPPFWSVPVDLEFPACVPQYELAVSLGCFTVPADRCLVIKYVSYEALNAVQNDVFELQFTAEGRQLAKWEDILIDAAAPNPAQKYALAGHFRPMPTHMVIDRNQTLCVRGILRGPIDLAGVSPYFPGQPIVAPDCHMRVRMQGWLAPLREDLDGGPRPTDLGDMDFVALMDDQQFGATS